jgi:hypothetical protein
MWLTVLEATKSAKEDMHIENEGRKGSRADPFSKRFSLLDISINTSIATTVLGYSACTEKRSVHKQKVGVERIYLSFAEKC